MEATEAATLRRDAAIAAMRALVPNCLSKQSIDGMPLHEWAAAEAVKFADALVVEFARPAPPELSDDDLRTALVKAAAELSTQYATEGRAWHEQADARRLAEQRFESLARQAEKRGIKADLSEYQLDDQWKKRVGIALETLKKFAEQHGNKAWIEGDALHVETTVVDTKTNESRQEVTPVRTMRELRALLGY